MNWRGHAAVFLAVLGVLCELPGCTVPPLMFSRRSCWAPHATEFSREGCYVERSMGPDVLRSRFIVDAVWMCQDVHATHD